MEVVNIYVCFMARVGGSFFVLNDFVSHGCAIICLEKEYERIITTAVYLFVD
jgi:hypothetical protein